MEHETPRSVMFNDLRRFGRITNRDAALLLLSPRAFAGGKSPRDRVDDRTFLSREVVHAMPDRSRPELFGDFNVTTQNLAARLIARRGGTAAARQEVASHYQNEGAEAMCAALAAFGLDDRLYRNAVDRISAAGIPEDAKAALYVMLFTVTGCLGGPQQAVDAVERFIASKMGSGFGATETTVGEGFDLATAHNGTRVAGRLGLLRIVGNAAKPPLHPLSTEPEGTIIGSLATGGSTISDVDRDVSRRHLRIWYENGRWLAQGLGSTNGTVLISSANKQERVVEPPRGQRAREAAGATGGGTGTAYPPLELHHGDTLVLGATTRFLVMTLAQ